MIIKMVIITLEFSCQVRESPLKKMLSLKFE
jgi:hypothetical protein